MTRNRRWTPPAAVAAAIITASACAAEPVGTIETGAGALALERIADGLEHPWGVAELPNGDFLVTERPGRLRLISADGLAPEPIAGAPEVAARAQGGLLDIALDPNFAANGDLYLSYSKPGPSGGAATALFKARFADGALRDGRDIYVAEPYTRSGHHFGSRIAFGPDGALYLSVGDRGDEDRAQDLEDPAGSILRMSLEGDALEDNPFFGRDDAAARIWSFGHRNPQGLAFGPDGALYVQEHGPRGGDEINVSRPGLDFGWPDVSFGRRYSGVTISDSPFAEGVTPPIHQWNPSIAPSGLAFYDADLIPGWRGDLLNGALKFQLLSRVDLDEGAVAGEERLLEGAIGRVRDVRIASDGAVLLLSDARNGGLYRLAPADAP